MSIYIPSSPVSAEQLALLLGDDTAFELFDSVLAGPAPQPV